MRRRLPGHDLKTRRIHRFCGSSQTGRLLLYVRGQLRAEDDKCLAIVGTRKASKYGWDVANQMAAEIADQGIAIVSGLAQGIDAAAHRGALSAGGRTIALIGTGIDQDISARKRRPGRGD